MDISQIKDPVQLKAMAYDEIAKKEQAETNLRMINTQLQRVLAAPAPKVPGTGETPAPSASEEQPTKQPEKPEDAPEK